MMRTVLAIILYLCSAANVAAQDRYFLCIQAEDHQPFYVRLSNKTWSSSSVGNLVVAGLGDSTYQVSIGFPKNKYPEQNFLITFNRKDLGYTLKQIDEQIWNLTSWENGEKISPRTGQTAEVNWYGEKKKPDAFTNLMAAVVNDSAVLYVASVKDLPGKQEVFASVNTTPVAKDSTMAVVVADSASHTIGTSVDSLLAIQKVVDSFTAVVPKDTAVIVRLDTAVGRPDSSVAMAVISKDTTAANSLVQVDSAVTVQKDSIPAAVTTDTPAASTAGPILVYSAPKPNIALVKDHVTPKGRSLMFIDSSASGVDSISIIIDAEPDTLTVVNNTGTPAKTVQSPAPVKTTTPEPSTTQAAPAPEAGEVKKDSSAEPAADKKKMVMMNSDCSNFATDNDIDKLRVKILDEPTIDSKLGPLRKLFKSKCIYTRQIRALSELYPNDEARFRFLELCYPYTADTSEFRTLVNVLSEDAYIARFKTLVRIKD